MVTAARTAAGGMETGKAVPLPEGGGGVVLAPPKPTPRWGQASHNLLMPETFHHHGSWEGRKLNLTVHQRTFQPRATGPPGAGPARDPAPSL